MKNKNKIHKKRKKKETATLCIGSKPHVCTVSKSGDYPEADYDKHPSPVHLISHGHFWTDITRRFSFLWGQGHKKVVTYWPFLKWLIHATKSHPDLINLNVISVLKALSVRLNQVSECWYDTDQQKGPASNTATQYIINVKMVNLCLCWFYGDFGCPGTYRYLDWHHPLGSKNIIYYC